MARSFTVRTISFRVYHLVISRVVKPSQELSHLPSQSTGLVTAAPHKWIVSQLVIPYPPFFLPSSGTPYLLLTVPFMVTLMLLSCATCLLELSSFLIEAAVHGWIVTWNNSLHEGRRALHFTLLRHSVSVYLKRDFSSVIQTYLVCCSSHRLDQFSKSFANPFTIPIIMHVLTCFLFRFWYQTSFAVHGSSASNAAVTCVVELRLRCLFCTAFNVKLSGWSTSVSVTNLQLLHRRIYPITVWYFANSKSLQLFLFLLSLSIGLVHALVSICARFPYLDSDLLSSSFFPSGGKI